ncbi:MAG TPA: hypothetical protein VMV25_02235 [Steroidobacteraceae bacterium]|nr:hypothetical protein [Steroidobacteraceae bacterium]
MPIHERDPWRLQYFADVACPADVFIPTDDADAYRWNPRHRGVYNKLLVAESQGLACAPHGVEPAHYPVFSKPIYNIEGMGVGGRALQDRGDYKRHCRPGCMWMTLLEGQHVSSDFAVIDGRMRWARHTIGLAGPGGTFDYWTCEARRLPALEEYCAAWIESNVRGYTGMLNLESIGGRIIEAHLRFADQWPDLYGAGWLDAMVKVYSHGVWEYADADRRTGYSVILFAPHHRRYAYPPAELAATIRATAAVSSLQFTFHQQQAAEAHAMPPGGFRLAVINVWDLAVGRALRGDLAHAFGIEAPAAAP